MHSDSEMQPGRGFRYRLWGALLYEMPIYPCTISARSIFERKRQVTDLRRRLVGIKYGALFVVGS